MSRKFNFVPNLPNYEYVREQMENDLAYRLSDRKIMTSLGRPLYYRINVQVIMTQECPYNCPFCLERQHPMKGCYDAEAQFKSLKKVLKEHPNARLTITGGEPGLYPEHVKKLIDIYNKNSNGIFCSINTSGYNPDINGMAHINLSINDYVKPNPNDFPNCTIQTVLDDSAMNISNITDMMNKHPDFDFSFRFLSGLNKHDYDISIFNELQKNPEFNVHTFRIGDFFMYVTFDYNNQHARITLGDMYKQQHNDYQDGYSNIIIHPNGRIGINWQ